MFADWKLSRKIAALVIVNLVIMIVLIIIAYVTMTRIGGEIAKVAEIDFPLADSVAEFRALQLQQVLSVERGIYDRMVGNRVGFIDSQGHFESLEAEAVAALTSAEEIASRAGNTVRDVESREQYRRFQLALEEIAAGHAAFVRAAEGLMDLADSSDAAAAEERERLVQIEEELLTKTSSLTDEIGQFALQSALSAEQKEQAAERSLALFGLLSALIAIVLGTAISRSLVRNLTDAMITLREVSGQMSSTIQQQRATTSETASAVSQTTSTVEELRQTAESATQKAETVAERSEATLMSSNEVRDAIRHGIKAMQQIREEVEEIARNILGLSEKNIQIGEIVGAVNAIAEQSNLLAVNASIEAAKAGDHGKGFSVVATEVRALAEKSKEATEQIRVILGETQKASNAAVMVTEQGTKKVIEGAALIDELGSIFERMNEAIEKSADAGRQIALTASQQLAGVQQITGAMQNIEQATSDNAAGAAQLERVANLVGDSAGALAKIVEGSTLRRAS